MESSASFTVAAKHLFRHLHDARALRKNALVRRFFEDPAIGGLGPGRDRAVLKRIHDLVRQAADHCREVDLLAGDDEHAMRRHAIVVKHCLERRALGDIAAELGISNAYLYRLRAHVCKRIAQYIRDHHGVTVLEYLADIDEFRLQMDRARRSAAFGDRSAAFQECNELIRIAPTELAKIEALRTEALVSLDFGDAARVEQAYLAAKDVLARSYKTLSTTSREIGQACVELIGHDLAAFRADKTVSLTMVQRAVARLAQIQENAPAHVRELYVEGRGVLGVVLWNLGLSEEAYDYIAGADADLRRLPSASPQLRSQVGAGLWKLRNSLLMSAKSWYPLAQRLRGAAASFEQAHASGFVVESVTSLLALVECHAFAGDDDEALRLGRFLVLLGRKQPSERIREQTAIEVALTLHFTKHWEAGLALLPNMHRLGASDAFHRELASYFPAVRAFRLGRFEDALALVRVASNREKYPRLLVRSQLIAAASAYELRQRRDACTLIETAIPVAERIRSVALLRDTYSLAAKVTGDARFRKQANEFSQLLIA